MTEYHDKILDAYRKAILHQFPKMIRMFAPYRKASLTPISRLHEELCATSMSVREFRNTHFQLGSKLRLMAQKVDQVRSDLPVRVQQGSKVDQLAKDIAMRCNVKRYQLPKAILTSRALAASLEICE